VWNAERIEAAGDVRHDAVDLVVGTDTRTVDGPGGKDVSEVVELPRCAKHIDDARMLPRRVFVVLQLLLERVTLAPDDRGVLIERPLDTANEVEDVVHPLRLWLRVPDQRRPQAPIVRAAAFGEVDEAGELRQLDVGGHLIQRKAATVRYAA